MNKEKYLEMTDAFLRQTGRDEIPDRITRDLRFCLDEQQKRLKEKGITLHDEFAFIDEAVTGAAEVSQKNNQTPFRGISAYRETVRIRDIYSAGKRIMHRREPVTFYACIVDKQGGGDVPVNCPNCGHASMASRLQEGCPYCGTHFAMSELYPRISSCYCVNNIVERTGLDERLKKVFLRIAAVFFVIFMIIVSVQNIRSGDYPIWAAELFAVLESCLLTAMMTFTAYMAYGFFLIGKVFHQFGSVLPMVTGLSSPGKLKTFMEKYDPQFFVRIFEGKMVSLLEAVLYSENRENLSIYEGNDDFSSFEGLVDLDYRGVFRLRDCRVKGERISVLLEVFTENCYEKGIVKRRNERILVRMERRTDAVTDPGFSIHAVRCGGCGGSFDAMHVRNCPYCGREYHAAADDWVITEIRKKS